MPRAKQRTPELRDRVLEAALDVLAHEGVEGFTTRGIARQADTSTPAVYELFGDKGGIVRAVFFEGFRRLYRRLDAVPETDELRADIFATIAAYRAFVVDEPVLAQVMLARPFTDFDPSATEIEASGTVRALLVARVRRCIDGGVLAGDPIDVAHALVALTQGLAAAESARRLGTSRRSIDRRWQVAVDAMLDGLAP